MGQGSFPPLVADACSVDDPAVSPAEISEDAEIHLDEIADALHDGPMQSLMVARYAADAAARGGDPGAAREAIQQAVVELRALVWSLRPRGESGLATALDQLTTSLVKADKLPLQLSLNADPVGPAAVLAYRLVQAVHAGAGRDQVRVTLDGPSLEVTGAPLPAPQRWIRRAAALSCRLSCDGDQTRLLLPTQPASSFSIDVRTTS